MSFVLKNIPLTQLTFTCSKSTIETLEKGVNFEYISYQVLLLLTLNKYMLAGQKL